MLVPSYDTLFNPVLEAMHRLGGSASIAEMDEEVSKTLPLSADEFAQLHNERQTELQYRLAWARTYLKLAGYINNSARGVWVLTDLGHSTHTVDSAAVKRVVKQRRSAVKVSPSGASDVDMRPSELIAVTSEEVEAALEESWRSQLLTLLLHLSSQAFERLCQRVLRESGFVEVRVTGKSGDGGIDGVGVVRLGGLLGFPVLFQCKRYQGTVGASAVRDFRGAMVGRADRGLIMATSTFSRDARLEATRDGAPPIDLVDGELFLDKMKELRLGVEVRMIEEIIVVPGFFERI